MPKIRPYLNGHSEPNSLHVHTYPSNTGQLMFNLTWEILHDDRWDIRPIVDKEEVPSHDFAMEKAKQIAIEKSIPVVLEQKDAT